MIRINLLPHKKVKPIEKGVQNLWMAVMALSVVAALGMAATFYMLYSKSSDLQKRTDSVDKELTVLKGKVAEVEGYEKSRVEYEDKIALISDLQKKRVYLTPFLTELNKAMLNSVWMTSLSENDGAFTINAMCKESRKAAEDFGDNLKKSQLLSDIEVKDVKEVPSGSPGITAYSFLVTGKIVGVEPAPAPAPEEAAKPAPEGKGKGKGKTKGKAKPKTKAAKAKAKK